MKSIFAALMLLFVSTIGAAQPVGHKITVNIQDLDEGPVLLAYHFGNRQFIQDTAKVASPGVFVFESSERLPSGIYLVVAPDQQLFELIIDQTQHFAIYTRKGAFETETRFVGSPENEAFFAYMKTVTDIGQQIFALQSKMSAEGVTADQKTTFSAEIQSLNQKITARQNQYIQLFPNCLFSLVLMAQRDPQPPLPPMLAADGSIDQFAMYKHYVANFWKNMNFSDARILRTPVFQNRLERYFGSVVMQIPDSIITAADRFLEKARANKEIFRFSLWFITSHFERSQIMGHDAVFIHMVEKYYLTGQADWATQTMLNQLRQRVARLKPLLIGNIAPNIQMFLPDKTPKALHQTQAQHTIVYFWDSECIHCVRVTPQLREMAKRFSPDLVQVFAVNIESDRNLWLQAVENKQIGHWINVNDVENLSGYREAYDLWSVPTIFLLDSEKRIVAKMVTVEQLEQIINGRLGINTDL